jgi:myosin-heavy-chain kinase
MSKSTSPASVLASLGSQTFPAADVSSLKNAERAFKWTLTIDSSLTPIWSCSVVVVEIEEQPFAKGSCRTAHKFKDLTDPSHPYVAKFSTKKASRDQYFVDVLMQTFCSKWADLYNSFNSPKKITFLPSFVLELVDRQTPVVCGGEPFIEGDYMKFNNNSGYVNNDAARNTPQAFSHFSLVHSNQELVIIDIQGVNDFYTDPQIHTRSGKGFGEGNLGQNGIHQFIKTHACNPLCTFLKLEALNSSKRMLLRGTLPVVQLDFDKSSQTAVIREDGQENAPKQPPPRPTRAPRDIPREPQPAQNPLQPLPAPPQQPPSSSWKPAAASPSHAQHPLQPVTEEEVAEAEDNANEPVHDVELDGADETPQNEQVSNTPAPEATWDLKAFKLLDTVRGTQAECVCADDKFVYTGSGDGSISIWDPVELKHVSNMKAHSKAVKSVILREHTLFSAGADAVIKEWDLASQKVINEAKDKGEVNAIFLSDNLLFSGSNDKTVKIYDSRSYTCTATLSSHTRAVKCLYVLGNYLFSGSNDQQVLVWSLQTNKVLTNLQGHEGWIKSLVGIGSTLFSGSHDETIRVWDLNTLQCQHTLKTKDKVEALLATPQALFSASGDYLEIWDSTSYSLASCTNARTSVLCLARHGPRIFCGSIGNHLKVWSCEPQPE